MPTTKIYEGDELLLVLRKRMHYDPATGLFTRILTTGSGSIAGSEPGTVDAHGYRVIRIGARVYKAHRLAWLYMTGNLPESEIDHIDGVRGNNTWKNLREVDRSTNMRNRRHASAGGTSKLLGVSWNKQKRKYIAQIKTNDGVKYLGQFDSEVEAHSIYVLSKQKFHVGAVL